MREYLAVVTRPGGGSEPLTMVEALADSERFATSFDVLEDGPEVGARLAELAAASRSRAVGCTMPTSLRPCWPHSATRLLTANRSDFQRLEPRIEVVGI